ncbi:MAG: T9SS type A sorting domain-containing protein [Flavobacteriales bacterium]|nr:T9SS type A sorting domain-containing protein [Flavobacteriales bacterium]
MTTRKLAALALLACILPAAAQQTFDFDQELVGQNSDDLFGWSLDLSGDGYTVIVGAIDNDGAAVGALPAGHARVYKNTYNAQFNSWSWNQVGADIDGTFQDEEAGYSVAVTTNGNTVAVGSPNRNKTRVYDRNGQNWVQRTANGFNIYSSEAPQRAGHAVSLSGNGHILAMGGPLARKVWIADISPGPGMGMITGVPIQLPGTYAGGSLDLDENGDNLVIGAYQANTNRGEVYVYQRSGNTWTQRGQTLQGVNNYDEFGFDVSINNNGNTIAVGIKGWDSNPNNTTYEIGQTAIYDWDGSQWVQRGIAIQGANFFDQCGYAVSLSGDGNRIAVGYRASTLAFTGGGQVRVFDWNGSAWVQNGDPILGDGTNVFCGHSVGLSDDGVVLGVGLSRGGVITPFGGSQGKVWMYEEADIMTGTPSLSAVELAIHPNPTSDRITVRSALAVARLELFDLSGGYVVGTVSQATLDLSGLAHGPYLVRVTFVDGGVAHARLVKQ